MKILINLVGLSHHDVGNHFIHILIVMKIYLRMLLHLLEKEYVVDFYLKTYDTDREEDIRKIYNQFIEFIPIQHLILIFNQLVLKRNGL